MHHFILYNTITFLESRQVELQRKAGAEAEAAGAVAGTAAVAVGIGAAAVGIPVEDSSASCSLAGERSSAGAAGLK